MWRWEEKGASQKALNAETGNSSDLKNLKIVPLVRGTHIKLLLRQHCSFYLKKNKVKICKRKIWAGGSFLAWRCFPSLSANIQNFRFFLNNFCWERSLQSQSTEEWCCFIEEQCRVLDKTMFFLHYVLVFELQSWYTNPKQTTLNFLIEMSFQLFSLSAHPVWTSHWGVCFRKGRSEITLLK